MTVIQNDICNYHHFIAMFDLLVTWAISIFTSTNKYFIWISNACTRCHQTKLTTSDRFAQIYGTFVAPIDPLKKHFRSFSIKTKRNGKPRINLRQVLNLNEIWIFINSGFKVECHLFSLSFLVLIQSKCVSSQHHALTRVLTIFNFYSIFGFRIPRSPILPLGFGNFAC